MGWNEKNKLASETWTNIGEHEKKTFKSSSDDFKSVKLCSLSEEQKDKLILRHRKKLLEEVPYIIFGYFTLLHVNDNEQFWGYTTPDP